MDRDRKQTTLTPRQVADILQISLVKTYQLLKEGDLPGRRVGGQWRIPERRFEEWLES